MHIMTTLVGHLTETPTLIKTKNSHLCKLRLASSRRVRRSHMHENVIANSDTEWVDTDTLFIDVECWGQLALNAKQSLIKGRPVLVHGYIFTQSWIDKETQQSRSKAVMRAHYIGLELSRYVVGSRKSLAGETTYSSYDELPVPHSSELPEIDIDYSSQEDNVRIGV
ncbi:single-stranded DNA-binding protein [Corynebacterium sp. sy039]|uniref:single-stranded DNA-binding protein n=1 Tax=Corynebacterium sp. sy039 TaxID=2599641 RepID=UPI00143DB696|nr:single-stranded DNA-binding protein [Corynebacterium sp. sy039]